LRRRIVDASVPCDALATASLLVASGNFRDASFGSTVADARRPEALMTTHHRLILALAFPVAALACEAPVDSRTTGPTDTASAGSSDSPRSSAPSEHVATSASALSTDVFWQKSGPGNLPMNAQNGLCFLTEVEGAFLGWGDSISIETAPDGTWTLGGTWSDGGFMQGMARCVSAKEMFNGTTNGFVNTYWVDYWVPGCTPGIACAQPAGENSWQLEKANQSVCVLTGITGQLNGWGEGAGVRVNAGGFWELYADSLSGAGVYATAACMSAGDGAPFLSQDDAWQQGNPPQWLGAFPPDAFCALSGLHGKFRGWGEGVLLEEAVNGSSLQWQLTGWSQQQNVSAYDQCFISWCKAYGTC
jgi:hypothetical protein